MARKKPDSQPIPILNEEELAMAQEYASAFDNVCVVRAFHKKLKRYVAVICKVSTVEDETTLDPVMMLITQGEVDDIAIILSLEGGDETAH